MFLRMWMVEVNHSCVIREGKHGKRHTVRRHIDRAWLRIVRQLVSANRCFLLFIIWAKGLLPPQAQCASGPAASVSEGLLQLGDELVLSCHVLAHIIGNNERYFRYHDRKGNGYFRSIRDSVFCYLR
jgi:hypothetical protein